MKMLRMFAKDDMEDELEEEIKGFKEAKVNDISLNNSNSIIDSQLMLYITKEFPQIAEEIEGSLNNLKNTIEKAIDRIADKSCIVIKEKRDFQLTGKYREVYINLHDISKDLTNYTAWINDNLSNNVKNNNKNKAVQCDVKEIIKEEHLKDKNVENKNILNECKIVDKVGEKFMLITDDFTSKHPYSFKIDEYKVNVENWNDMVIKTAELLNKKYKENRKNSSKATDATICIRKKSKQNDFRDTIIELLQDYNIELDRYRVLAQ